MKRVFIYALVLLIAFAIYACNTEKEKTMGQKGVENTAQTMSISEEEVNIINFLHTEDDALLKIWNDTTRYADDPNQERKNLRIHPVRSGGRISQKKAKQKMAEFRKRNTGTDNNPIITPYAFAFGREQMRNLLDQMDSINEIMGRVPSEDSLQGVRVYLTSSIVPNDSPHMDVLIVPVHGNGLDFIQLDKINDLLTDPILNVSIPCPNNCD